MGGPFDPFRPQVVKRGRSQESIVRATTLLGSVVTLCPCGSEFPIQIPVIPLIRPQVTCMSCRTSFVVRAIRFNANLEDDDATNIQLEIEIARVDPEIAIPQGALTS